tara:strand:- start:140 stop:667 length:528 start_codon:yes stop_codon:yes gene_type:complete
MIKSYENFLSPSSCQLVYNLVISSLYRIGWDDSNEPQHKPYPNLHSEYSFQDLQKLKILEPILKKLKNKNITVDNYFRCMINLTKPLDVNFIHSHPDQWVALYYANLTWNPEWGGETLFYKNNKKDILLCSPYIPNKLLIFDGGIPHTIKAQNLIGPSYRFTISIFFNKEKNESK